MELKLPAVARLQRIQGLYFSVIKAYNLLRSGPLAQLARAYITDLIGTPSHVIIT